MQRSGRNAGRELGDGASSLPCNPQRLHAVGEFGADGDVLRAGSLAGAAVHTLAGALRAVLAVKRVSVQS